MKIQVFATILALAVGSGLGYWIGLRTHIPIPKDTTCLKSFLFLNPYLECEKKPILKKTSLNSLRNTLLAAIDDTIQKGDATHVSVYLYDLVNGPTLGINQNEKFQPASLLKLPILMAYYKLAEEKPEILTQSYGYTGVLDSGGQTIAQEHTIRPDTMYTTNELLQKMISYSDNRSKELLKVKLPVFSGNPNYMLQTYIDLGLLELNSSSEDSITVKMYASLFRLLFNVSYLNTELSNKALDLLSQSDYTNGLVAGVPAGTRVAHKFGEGGSDKFAQLHDCGIIYFPGNPYSLCVMTRGVSYEKLERIIAEISALVYKEMESRKL